MDDERLDDRVADEIRTRLMRQVMEDRARVMPIAPRRAGRAWFPVATSFAVAVLVVAASIAVLLAVHRPPVAAPRREQARMFDGSCGSVLTPAQVRQAVGEAVIRPVDTTRAWAAVPDAGVTPLFALGGLRCDWGTGRRVADQAALFVAAAPIALAPKKVAAPYCYSSSSGGPMQTSCTFDRRSGKVWFTGQLTVAKGGEAVVLRRLAALGAALDAAARQPGASVPLAKRAKGSWARRTDCAALVRSADLATVLHTPGLVGESGNGATEQPQAQLTARDRLGATPCLLDSSSTKGWAMAGVEFAVFPDAAVVERVVRMDPTATTHRLASGRRVVVTTGADGLVVVHAFDGPDYLQLAASGRPVARLLRAVDPLLQRLDATR